MRSKNSPKQKESGTKIFKSQRLDDSILENVAGGKGQVKRKKEQRMQTPWQVLLEMM